MVTHMNPDQGMHVAYTPGMTTTTIKVSTEVRDRLKAQAAQAHRTLGAHLAHLADLEERQVRFQALRAAIDKTSDEAMASYRLEVAAWDRLDIE